MPRLCVRLTVVAVLLLSACSQAIGPAPSVSLAPLQVSAAPLPPSSRAYALLANNHLLVADVVGGTLTADVALAAPTPAPSIARSMALTSDGARLFVLVSDAINTGRVVAVDTRTFEVKVIVQLPAASYRGLAVGVRSGYLYLFANEEGSAQIIVVDPLSGTLVWRWTARPAEGRDWLIYEGAVSDDERSLYLSYHGPDTTGIDRFEIGASLLTRCAIPARAGSGCFAAHGSFALTPVGLIATAAEQPIVRLDPTTGIENARYDMHLGGNHLMEFAVASKVGRLYAIGSCGYVGGLAVTQLSTGQTQLLAAPRSPGAPCGDRIVTLEDGSLLVLAKNGRPVPENVPASLSVLGSDGALLRSISTSAEAMDLLVVH